MIPLSVLDPVPVRSGSAPREAMQESVDRARLAERLGFVHLGWVRLQRREFLPLPSPEEGSR